MGPSILTRAGFPAICTAVALAALPATQARGQDVCGGVTCETLPDSICDPGGFNISLTGFEAASGTNSGVATYTYSICSPAEGVCNGTARPGESCLDNSFCQRQGQAVDLNATCNRDCAVDEFSGLSHFDIGLPAFGVDSCLPEDTEVTVTCSSGTASSGPDGSCGGFFSAKCDNPELAPGECLTMTVSIPGEENAPGLGAAVLVSKASNECDASCLAGPSCEPCEDDDNGVDECLTRTRGFWSTHPHIIQNLDLLPINVCGEEQTVTDAGVCGTSEALCTNAKDRRGNEASLTLVAQLTAAKLNLEATDAVTIGDGACEDFEYDGTTIQEWIDYCETGFCGESKQQISASGCIEALDAFNNSQDTGFDQTPEPFNRPGPALVQECQEARQRRQQL